MVRSRIRALLAFNFRQETNKLAIAMLMHAVRYCVANAKNVISCMRA